MTAAPLTALIADDEELARSLLASLVRHDPGLQLSGTAADGGDAIVRFGSRFEFVAAIPADCEYCLVPALILQPLIDVHGK